MSKKNIILAIVLGALILIAYFYQGPIRKWRENSNKPQNFFLSIDTGKINKITLKKGGKTIVLEKLDNSTDKDKSWKIQNTKAFFIDNTAMAAVFESLKEIQKTGLETASKSKDSKINFQTDADNGTLVKVEDGKNEIEFILGKVGPDFSSVYISQPAISETYLAKNNLSSLNREDWLDKTIFSSDKEKINKIRFQYPDAQLIIEKATTTKNNSAWKGVAPKDFNVNPEKISEVLNIMSTLEAAEIPDQTINLDSTGIGKHNIIVEASGDGIDNILMLGDENKDGLVYAKRGSDDNIYLITKTQRDNLKKQIKDLK